MVKKQNKTNKKVYQSSQIWKTALKERWEEQKRLQMSWKNQRMNHTLQQAQTCRLTKRTNAKPLNHVHSTLGDKLHPDEANLCRCNKQTAVRWQKVKEGSALSSEVTKSLQARDLHHMNTYQMTERWRFKSQIRLLSSQAIRKEDILTSLGNK